MAQLKSTIINGNLTITGDILNNENKSGYIKAKHLSGNNNNYYITWDTTNIIITVDNTQVLKIPANYGDTSKGETKFYTAVYSGLGANYLYISAISGYSLISAYNGDWDAASYIPLGIAQQKSNYVIFFNSNVPKGQPIRITSVWRRND